MIHTNLVETLKPTYDFAINDINLTLEHDHDKKCSRADVPTKPVAASLMRPSNDESKQLLNILNVHCLLDIFAHLDVNTLCTVRRTCKIFERFAKPMINRMVRNELQYSHLPEFGAFSTSLWRIEDYLLTIGKSITTATIQTGQYEFEILPELITKYCNNIKDLTITLDGNDVDEWIGIFLVGQSKLEALKIQSPTRHQLVMPQVALPQLTRLLIARVEITNHPSVKTFFALNKQIEVLALDDVEISDECVESNFEDLINLKHLHIRSSIARNIQSIVHLLKEADVPVEHIMMDAIRNPARNNNILETIASCRHIKTLNVGPVVIDFSRTRSNYSWADIF